MPQWDGEAPVAVESFLQPVDEGCRGSENYTGENDSNFSATPPVKTGHVPGNAVEPRETRLREFISLPLNYDEVLEELSVLHKKDDNVPTTPTTIPTPTPTPTNNNTKILSSDALGGAATAPTDRSLNSHSDTRSNTNLHLSNLSHETKEDDLRKLFHRYGEIDSMFIMRDIHTGESQGIAFVRYASPEDARRALEGMSGAQIDGQEITVKWANKQHDNVPVGEARKRIRKLFVRNIPCDVTSKELRRVFRVHGPVCEVTIHKDTKLQSLRWRQQPERRIAFVTYIEDGAAERACEALNNTLPFPSCGNNPVMLKLAVDGPQYENHNKRNNNNNNRYGNQTGKNLQNTSNKTKKKQQTEWSVGEGNVYPGGAGVYGTSPMFGCFPTVHGTSSMGAASTALPQVQTYIPPPTTTVPSTSTTPVFPFATAAAAPINIPPTATIAHAIPMYMHAAPQSLPQLIICPQNTMVAPLTQPLLVNTAVFDPSRPLPMCSVLAPCLSSTHDGVTSGVTSSVLQPEVRCGVMGDGGHTGDKHLCH